MEIVVLRYPTIVRWVAVITCLFLFGIGIYLALDGQLFYMASGAFIMMIGVIGAMQVCLFRVILDQDCIKYRGGIGFTRNYDYRKIENMIYRNQKLEVRFTGWGSSGLIAKFYKSLAAEFTCIETIIIIPKQVGKLDVVARLLQELLLAGTSGLTKAK